MKVKHRALLVIGIVLIFLSVLLVAKMHLDKHKIPTLDKSTLTVVIDPGHRGENGRDNGAHYGGIDEADLNDDVAGLLFALLKEDGYNVVLSRALDEPCAFADLNERVAYINSMEPDLIISIHHNAIGEDQSTVKGYSVYYSSYKPGMDDEGIIVDFVNKSYPFVEEKINKKDVSVVYYDDNGTTRFVEDGERLYYVKDTTPNRVAQDSALFAGLIDEEFLNIGVVPPLSYRHYKSVMEADFRVLKSTTAPSAMIEVGYMSNKDELKILKEPQNQKQFALALKRAIDRYFELQLISESE